MNTKRFLVPALTSALLIAAGCQSGSQQTSVKPPPMADAKPVQQVAVPSQSSMPALPVIRIKAGQSAIKDSTGVDWLGDSGFEGGDVIERPDLQIANVKSPEIYRSEHYSMDSFAYKLPNGKYQVKLHFCETYEGITGPGERVFSFDVEGRVFKDFDVWAKSGGFARAYVETVPVEIADSKLDIKFTPNVENPQINGIEIIPVQ